MKCLHRIIILNFLFCFFSFGVFAADDLIHVVGKGETFYSISRFYGITSDALMKANNISDPSKLQTGLRLKIPSASSVSVLPGAVSLVDYKAVKGDTLFSIARKNNITLKNLQELNKFSENHVLKVGDIIKVPGGSGGSALTVGGLSNQGLSHGSSNQTTSTMRVQPGPSGIYSLRWPVSPKEITYMSGQMGVVVEGERLESVKSLTQGNVVSAGPWRKFGRVIIVESSGGYYYMYGGCESITVNVGDRITPGMELGRLGVNAVSEKPQLFFMVFRNETPMDPALAPRA